MLWVTSVTKFVTNFFSSSSSPFELNYTFPIFWADKLYEFAFLIFIFVLFLVIYFQPFKWFFYFLISKKNVFNVVLFAFLQIYHSYTNVANFLFLDSFQKLDDAVLSRKIIYKSIRQTILLLIYALNWCRWVTVYVSTTTFCLQFP